MAEFGYVQALVAALAATRRSTCGFPFRRSGVESRRREARHCDEPRHAERQHFVVEIVAGVMQGRRRARRVVDLGRARGKRLAWPAA